MSHSKIPLIDKLIYRALDSGHAAFAVSGNLLVRPVAELMPPMPVPKIAVDHHCLFRNLVTIDHFEFPHRHHNPFFAHLTLQAKIRRKLQ